MHGLIVRSIHCFLRDIHGASLWAEVWSGAGPAPDDIDVLRSYPNANAAELLERAARRVGQPIADLLEDLGVYLASHPSSSGVRRLLRFGGDTFVEFLYSLPELRDRARLAVEDLDLPRLELRQHFAGTYSLSVVDGMAGSGHVLAGVLRAMADDYGSLVLLENTGKSGTAEVITITVHDLDYGSGQSFALAHGQVTS